MSVILLAHEAWFVPSPERFPLQWALLTAAPTLTAVALALGAVGTFAAVDARWGEPRLRVLDPLARLRPYLARILAVAIGLALVGTALIDGYLAPSMVLPKSSLGRLLNAVAIAIAVLLMVGWRRRAVAALLAAAGPLGMLAYGVRPVLERADLLGAAVYLALAHGHDVEAERRARFNPLASLVMRFLAAVAIGVLAFTEKLLNPALAQAFLDLHPEFDLFRLLGLGSSGQFISFAATMELVLAALLLAGRLPRLTVVLVGTPFIVTAPLLGVRELVGHLPLYAVLLVVLVEAQVRRLPAEHRESPRGVEQAVTLREALRAFNARCYLACSAMIGIASEQRLLRPRGSGCRCERRTRRQARQAVAQPAEHLRDSL